MFYFHITFLWISWAGQDFFRGGVCDGEGYLSLPGGGGGSKAYLWYSFTAYMNLKKLIFPGRGVGVQTNPTSF